MTKPFRDYYVYRLDDADDVPREVVIIWAKAREAEIGDARRGLAASTGHRGKKR